MDGYKKFQRYLVKEVLLYNHIELFYENFHQKWKNASCGAQFKVLPNQVRKKSFYMFEDIHLREFHAKFPEQNYIKGREKLWAQIQLKSWKSVSTVFLEILTDFRCILHSVRLEKCEVHLLRFKTSPYRKTSSKNYL